MIAYPTTYASRIRFRRESLRNRFGIPRTRTRTYGDERLHASSLCEGDATASMHGDYAAGDIR